MSIFTSQRTQEAKLTAYTMLGNLGLAVYFFITPELAYYESDALKYEEDNDEALEENEILFDE